MIKRNIVLLTLAYFSLSPIAWSNTSECLYFYNPQLRRSEVSTLETKETLRQRSRSEFRQDLVQKYLLHEVTTQRDRELFVQHQINDKGAEKIVIEFENSKLKLLNDIVKDKDFITAIDNYANAYVLNKVEQWIKTNYPEMTLYKYSDGKSLTVDLVSGAPLQAIHVEAINEGFASFQSEFASLLKSKKIFRDSDKTEEWFRMGVGRTSDEAYFAARISRKLSGPNRVIHFSSPAIQKKLVDLLFYADYFRAQIASSDKLRFLLEHDSVTQQKIPSLALFEILRKAGSPKTLASSFFERFQLHLEPNEVDWLFNYAEIVDLMNPKFFVVDQTVVTLANAVNGGIVVDRKGMGAANQRASALAALHASYEVVSNKKLVDLSPAQLSKAAATVIEKFMKLNREQEALVTAEISLYRERMEKEWGAKCRGDDCVIEDISNINLAVFLNSDLIRGQRVVRIPPGIALPEARSEMSTHGEAIEKSLAKQLYKYLKRTTLEELTFAVDFKTTTLNSGKVNLIVNPLNSAISDKGLERLIHVTFELAVADFNTEQKKLLNESFYEVGSVVDLSTGEI